jgi:hypothetical protein
VERPGRVGRVTSGGRGRVGPTRATPEENNEENVGKGKEREGKGRVGWGGGPHAEVSVLRHGAYWAGAPGDVDRQGGRSRGGKQF